MFLVNDVQPCLGNRAHSLILADRWEPLQVKPAPGQWDPIGEDMGQAH